MNRYLFLILGIITSAAFGQQRPQYTQYVLNNYLLNPALSGMENYTDIKMGYRQQWKGLEGAPQTSFVTANFALGDAYLWKNPLSFDVAGNDPRNQNYQQNYTASPAHHGVGFSVVLDKAAQLKTAAFNISYAYHIPLNGSLNLSAGLAAGVTRIGIDANALLLENPNDPALKNAGEPLHKPDLTVGLWLYGAQFFTGLSIQQLLPQKLSFTDDVAYNKGKQIPHFFLTAGYKINLVEDFNLTPSVMIKKVNYLPLSADVNAKLNFKDKLWIGAGYRANDSMNMMAGININHQFNLTYSYDFTTSELNQVSSGSHEIVLGILLNNVYKVICPQKMW